MREIKFRVWDSTSKVMIYSENPDNNDNEYPTLLTIGLHGLPILIDRDSFKTNEIVGWNVDHNRFIQQFIGLKDKNGVEIYEGDILNFNISFVYGEPLKGVIVFKTASFVVKTNYSEYNMNHVDEIQIIGNIYENPELLEK